MHGLMSQEMVGDAMAYRRDQVQEAPRGLKWTALVRVSGFFMALFAVSLFYVWSHAHVLQATYGLSDLHQREKELISQNDKLKLEIATLRSPAALSAKAAGHLDLVPPQPGQIVMVK